MHSVGQSRTRTAGVFLIAGVLSCLGEWEGGRFPFWGIGLIVAALILAAVHLQLDAGVRHHARSARKGLVDAERDIRNTLRTSSVAELLGSVAPGSPPAISDPGTARLLERSLKVAGGVILIGVVVAAGGVLAIATHDARVDGDRPLYEACAVVGAALGLGAIVVGIALITRWARLRSILSTQPWRDARADLAVSPDRQQLLVLRDLDTPVMFVERVARVSRQRRSETMARVRVVPVGRKRLLVDLGDGRLPTFGPSRSLREQLDYRTAMDIQIG